MTEENETQVQAQEPMQVQQPKSLRLLQSVYGWVETFVLTLGALLLLLSFVGRYAPVDGTSMLPTLKNNDLVVLSGLGYTPTQGDVVVVQSKKYGYKEPLVKRIIATSGQTVTLDYANWTVTVDGTVLQEDYILRQNGPMETGDPNRRWNEPYTFTVPEGKLFVMGDNRNGSADSRDPRIGFIDERLVVGKVYYRLLPFESIGKIR